jgi:hypothetical protein
LKADDTVKSSATAGVWSSKMTKGIGLVGRMHGRAELLTGLAKKIWMRV